MMMTPYSYEPTANDFEFVASQFPARKLFASHVLDGNDRRRRVTVLDGTTVAHLRAARSWFHRASDVEPLIPNASMCWFDHLLQVPFGNVLSVDLDGEPLGFADVCIFEPRLRMDKQFCGLSISHVEAAPGCRYTDPAPRRFRGVGRLLIRGALRIAQDNGVDRVGYIALDVDRGFAAHLGFDEEGKVADHWLLPQAKQRRLLERNPSRRPNHIQRTAGRTPQCNVQQVVP